MRLFSSRISKLKTVPALPGAPRQPRRPARMEPVQLVAWDTTEPSTLFKMYLLTMAFLVLVLSTYLFRLWYLQLVNGAKYRYYSENNRIRLEEIPAPRGVVFDRSGTVLVENRPAYHLLMIREDVPDVDEAVRQLAALCQMDAKHFYEVLEASKDVPPFLPIRVVADMDRDCLARVDAHLLRLPGVLVQVEPKREYRWNGVASHLIGYMGEISDQELKSEQFQGYIRGEAVGKFGVEKAFEKFLHGRRGGRQVEVDAIGRRIRLLDELNPVAGRNLWLTIDIELQRLAEECLKDRVGSIVAIDPRDGAVLAMASTPSFDQEQFIRGMSMQEWKTVSEDPNHPLLNRAIGAAYPPGSTYKPILALAALQEDVMKPGNRVSCPGYLAFANRNYRCWRERGHGSVDLQQAIVQSCDVYFYQTGLKLGVDRIAKYARMLGLGTRTQIGLDREHPGLIPTSLWKKNITGIPWQKGETLSIAIGQGYDLATPLQMAIAYATIATEGKVWQPYVVKRVEGARPEEVRDFAGKIRSQADIAKNHFALVKQGLLGVVEEPRGTAHGIKHKTIAIAGKTGTAQVVEMAEGVNRKHAAAAAKLKDRDHAWFVAYAPAHDPAIVVAVLVEHGGHGSSAAAPLAQKVISRYLEGEPTPGVAPEPKRAAASGPPVVR
jgi:penicillin-binding protein 2